MHIDFISDLHGYTPTPEQEGDLVIIAGDLTACDKPKDHEKFHKWLKNLKYDHKIIIAGNHDNFLHEHYLKGTDASMPGCVYLCDSSICIDGIKIYGSPWTMLFDGINAKTCAFTVEDDVELMVKWDMIPDDTDILVTHMPPYGIFDQINPVYGRKQSVGSLSLREHVLHRIKPKIHVFGHIHENGGRQIQTKVTQFINASHVDDLYFDKHGFIRSVLKTIG